MCSSSLYQRMHQCDFAEQWNIPLATCGFDIKKRESSCCHEMSHVAAPRKLLAPWGEMDGLWLVSHSPPCFEVVFVPHDRRLKREGGGEGVTHDEMKWFIYYYFFKLIIFSLVPGGACEVKGAGGRWTKPTTERQREPTGETQAARGTTAAGGLPDAQHCPSMWDPQHLFQPFAFAFKALLQIMMQNTQPFEIRSASGPCLLIFSVSVLTSLNKVNQACDQSMIKCSEIRLCLAKCKSDHMPSVYLWYT